jgi:hypothetical protein
MDAFEQREDGYEKRFAIEEEKRFRALARRNSLLGWWAASLIGLAREDAEAHARALVADLIEHPGDDALARRLGEELDRAGIEMSDHRVRHKMAEALAQAEAELGGAVAPSAPALTRAPRSIELQPRGATRATWFRRKGAPASTPSA